MLCPLSITNYDARATEEFFFNISIKITYIEAHMTLIYLQEWAAVLAMRCEYEISRFLLMKQ